MLWSKLCPTFSDPAIVMRTSGSWSSNARSRWCPLDEIQANGRSRPPKNAAMTISEELTSRLARTAAATPAAVAQKRSCAGRTVRCARSINRSSEPQALVPSSVRSVVPKRRSTLGAPTGLPPRRVRGPADGDTAPGRPVRLEPVLEPRAARLCERDQGRDEHEATDRQSNDEGADGRVEEERPHSEPPFDETAWSCVSGW